MGHLRIAFSVIFFSFHTKSRRETHFFPFPYAGFRRKEFRGKLAIAITANFINRNSTAEAKVEEISGVAFIFNQKFFQDLKEETGETVTFLQTRPPSLPKVLHGVADFPQLLGRGYSNPLESGISPYLRG